MEELIKRIQLRETIYLDKLEENQNFVSFPRRRESRIMNDKQYYVYIICNKRNGTLYTGITSDLIKRVWQHKKGLVEGFSKRYGLKTLIYFEAYQDVEEAILREKRIKKWNRKWKINLIEKANPNWNDLYQSLV